MADINPLYSVYVDTRNGYSIGFHKINLRADQLEANDTYTWDVPRLAPGSVVGTHLSLDGQFPNLANVTNGGGDDRNTASASVTVSIANLYAKKPDGSLDLIYATFHQGAINNSVRT